jgi:hypothetical protein
VDYLREQHAWLLFWAMERAGSSAELVVYCVLVCPCLSTTTYIAC